MSFDVRAFRALFPMFKKEMIYLDSAATMQKPQVVIDRLSTFYSDQYATVNRAIYPASEKATQAVHGARFKVAQFIGATSADEIVFTRGATDSANIIAAGFARLLKRGDEIIVSALEHHANLVPWQDVVERTGATLVILPLKLDGSIDIDAFKRLLNSKTVLVCLSHMSNVTGVIQPIQEMCALAHMVGAKVVVDGAQAVVHFPINMIALDVDFYFFSSHKLYGPTGVGVLYGKDLSSLPITRFGGDMIAQVELHGSTYTRPPLCFEPGTPMIAEIIGLGAAIDFVSQHRSAAMQAHEEELFAFLDAELRKMEGVVVLGPESRKHRSGLISIAFEGIHPLDVGTLLGQRGIAVRTGHLCAQPYLKHFGLKSALRISLAPYNSKAEIDTLLEALRHILNTLKL